MIRTDSSWSGLPQAPNIIVPRQYVLTLIRVPPSVRLRIGATLPRHELWLSPPPPRTAADSRFRSPIESTPATIPATNASRARDPQLAGSPPDATTPGLRRC